MSVRTRPSYIQQVKNRPGSNAASPLAVAFVNLVWVLPRHWLGGFIHIVLVFSLMEFFRFVFVLGTGAMVAVWAPLSSEAVLT